MKRILADLGVCDCHSHVYGPFSRFPLSEMRTFTPRESTVESLETVWSHCGIDRAVLIQGSASGTDHSALLDAISRNPSQRRGIAMVAQDVTDEELNRLHEGGVRGIRFNWVSHLLGGNAASRDAWIDIAIELMERVRELGWHAEVHIDAQQMEMLLRLSVASETVVVIDHMARINAAGGSVQQQLNGLLKLFERENIWVKISGADRVAAECQELSSAIPIMRAVVRQAPEKCVWGLDWPHVNQARLRSDDELFHLLESAVSDETTLRAILIDNPARLYGFPASTGSSRSEAMDHQGVISS